jgi:hypothetical protein
MPRYASLSSLLLMIACVPCDRAGCEAMEVPAPSGDIQTGIAGAASSQSDVVTNGCSECTLSQGTLYVWASPAPLDTKDDVVALITAAPEDVRIAVDEYYQQELEPGTYAACLIGYPEGQCATVTIAEGEVATVHMAFAYGPSSLVVFDPGSNTSRSDGIYDLMGSEVPDVSD